MNLIIENEIKKTLEMQRDSVLAGEIPPGLADYDYMLEMYIECEELSEDLATVLTREVVENALAYAEENGYYVVDSCTEDSFVKLTVESPNRVLISQIGYNKTSKESIRLAVKWLADRYEKLMFL